MRRRGPKQSVVGTSAGRLASCLLASSGCSAHIPARAPTECPEARTDPAPGPERRSRSPGCAICCDGKASDDRPPRIRKARFKDASTLELAFTERIADPGAVDPNQFRLSLAMAYGYEDYGSLYYADIGEYGDGDSATPQTQVVPSPTPGRGETSSQGPLRFTSMSVTEDGRRLELVLADEIPEALCEYIREYQREISMGRVASGLKLHAEFGLYLHYTHHGRDRIRDRAGNPLADIGGEWALRYGAAYAASYFTGAFRSPLGDLLEVPCPR